MLRIPRLAPVTLALSALALVGAAWLAQGQPTAAQQPGIHLFAVKFVCGSPLSATDPELAIVRPGVYATEINIHNPNPVRADVRKRFIPLVMNGKAVAREPEFGGIKAEDAIALPPSTATFDDCARIQKLLGLAPGALLIGFMELVSREDLTVDAVYTVEGRGGSSDVEVVRVPSKLVFDVVGPF
jgi:hypothetical protein